MSSPFSYKESCTGCGTCVFVCPKALLVLDNGRPMMPEENWARCNSCGQCVAYCPVGGAEQALSLGKSLDPVTPMTVSLGENIEGVLKSRRSYRTFSTLPVSRSLINRILDVVNYAPSGGNNRLIRWIISDNMAKSKEIAKLIADWMDTDCRTDPVLSKRYAVDSILKRVRQGKDVLLRGAPCVAFTVGPKEMTWGGVDSGIALTYFNLACEAHNIGCCFAGYAANAARMSDALRDYLGIKPDEDCYCAICFGHKTIAAHRVPARPAVPVSYL